ncbi:FtsX-like permease family protein [Specibacter sp. NPDC057265]|uniref:ABC transporter permease n=1 Tax=Specibacter sp. NPDC057265 TaxID=3346075 RepID=UPI003640B8D2
MLALTFSQLKSHSRRFIAITLAVLLAVAFLSATLMVNASTKASLKASIGQSYAAAEMVVSPSYERPLTLADAEKIALSPLVAQSYPQLSVYAQSDLGKAALGASLRNLPEHPQLQPVKLLSGSWPANDTEVTVDEVTAGRNELTVGSTVSLSGPAQPDAASGVDTEPVLAATISGIMAASSNPIDQGTAQFVGTRSAVEQLGSADLAPEHITLNLVAGTSTSEAKTALAAALDRPEGAILTTDEMTTQMVASFTGGDDQLTIVLLAFAAVALLVATLVVANTFSVIIAQRTRELALLRCIGAGRGQIRRSVVMEALVVGLVASVLGVAAATGTMALVVGVLGQNPDFNFAVLAVPPSAVIAGLLVGTVLTVLASLVPARAATAVAPLAALRPADDVSVHNAGGVIRLISGVVLLLAGGAGLVAGGMTANLPLALPAGAASFVGFLMAASLFVPKLVSFAGTLARPAGVPGRMAAENAVRNPRRTTATASALLIGVTLVTMMMTGAATARTALDSELASSYPVDMLVRNIPGSPRIADSAVAQAAQLPGVKHIARLELVGTVESGGTTLDAYGISDADAQAVLSTPGNRPSGTTAVIPRNFFSDSVALTAGAQSTNLTAVPSTTDSFAAIVSLDSFVPLPAGDPLYQDTAAPLWIAVDASLDANAALDLQSELASTLGVELFQVDGAVLEKIMFNQVIDLLLLVVTGLLAVAVFIALIGVANTLSLSVLERTRENSLLRALGLTRGQLRGMLALEAVLIAGVAAVIGSVLGAVYGWAGAQSALGSFAEVTAVIPWVQIAAVVVVAAVAGLLASVVPARRAAKLSPVQGLAMD